MKYCINTKYKKVCHTQVQMTHKRISSINPSQNLPKQVSLVLQDRGLLEISPGWFKKNKPKERFPSKNIFDPLQLSRMINFQADDNMCKLLQGKKPSGFQECRLTYKKRIFETRKATHISGKITFSKKALQLCNCKAGYSRFQFCLSQSEQTESVFSHLKYSQLAS